jgi:hypothetical protein
MENEIIFIVEESPEGGWTSKALGYSIYTEADTIEELKTNIRDAVNCHFENDNAPKILRLHYVKDEFISA